MPSVALGLGIVSTLFQIKSGVEQKKLAKKQERAQNLQTRIQHAMTVARQRREARIKKARTLATAGAAGIAGSTVTGGVRGIESTLKGNIALGQEQVGISERESAISAEQLSNQGTADIVGAVGTFSSEFFTPDKKTGTTRFTDITGIGE